MRINLTPYQRTILLFMARHGGPVDSETLAKELAAVGFINDKATPEGVEIALVELGHTIVHGNSRRSTGKEQGE